MRVAVNEENEEEEVLHKFQLHKAVSVRECEDSHATLSVAEEHHASWDR